MKKFMLTSMVVSAFLLTTRAEAQIRVNVDLNNGRPSWGLPGNHSGDYYYLPEIDSYYDIPGRQFIYSDGRNWIHASQLPYAYRDYNLFGGYKVLINEPRPYLLADAYRQKYSRYYNTYRRPVIVDPDHGYQNNYPNYPNNRNDRYDRNRYERGRDNQHFDNKRKIYKDDNDDDDDHYDKGKGNKKWRNGHDNGRALGRKW